MFMLWLSFISMSVVIDICHCYSSLLMRILSDFQRKPVELLPTRLQVPSGEHLLSYFGESSLSFLYASFTGKQYISILIDILVEHHGNISVQK